MKKDYADQPVTFLNVATWQDQKLATNDVCYGGVCSLNPDNFIAFDHSQELIKKFNVTKAPTFIVIIPERGLILYRDDKRFLDNPDEIMDIALSYVQ